MTRNVDQLRSIQTFEELIPFLEDDLDWPFPHGSQDYEFDDLTFEYTPEELGLEEEFAAKIKRIHQLRPLVGGQPWGIFFVEFENKKLPVVVLRRILSHLVLKQRKSANPADRARWNAGDLLFISAFAEEGTLQREIAFAHFHQDPGDQPTLRVLGWDGGDTPLKLEHVSQLLKQRLSWPRNPADHAAWRKQWAGAFRYKIGEQIRTADLLARELARVARNIRDAAMALMKVESSRGPLRRMHEAFRTALIHDLTQEGFADTYAQTITYGLLTAAISRTDRSAGADGTFVLAEDIHNMVPITNPFLKEMLESFLKVGGRGTSKQPGLDFDELGVQEVVELLRSSDIDLPAVLEDFGNRNPGEDPVIRFYEDFLKAYNKELKVKRGVFYTPQPVVSYIVRSVHELLQTEFGLSDGLASTITWGEMAAQMSATGKSFSIPDGTSPDSHFVIILDPATGTATFLVEVIDVVFRTLTKKWKAARLTSAQQKEEWNRYVPTHLLPRLFGYELMMAPYAIAHMKLGLKLGETGYTFGTEQRVRIYLTNAMEPAHDFSDRLAFDIPALAHEAHAVNTVKRHQQFTVVLGNPPYSKSSQNQGPWIEGLMDSYKRTVRKAETQIQALSDDYAKFFRFAHYLLEQSKVGVLHMITNNGFIDGPLFRDMRSSLVESFSDVRVLNLHGDSRKQFAPPDGLADENVFDIQQGVATTVCWLGIADKPLARVFYSELWGSRAERYSALLAERPEGFTSEPLEPSNPFYLFIPMEKELEQEFNAGWHLYDIFGSGDRAADNHHAYGAGFVTQQDTFAIGFSPSELVQNVETFVDPEANTEWLWKKFQFCSTNQWDFDRARRELFGKDVLPLVKQCLYRPFDNRFTVFDRNICTIIRKRITSQFDQENLALLVTRRVTRLPYNNVFVSDIYTEYKVASHDRNTIVFPLWLYPEDEVSSDGLFLQNRRLNLNPAFVKAFEVRLKMGNENQDDIVERMQSENVFAYVYAILYSNLYRNRYGELLKVDFPRIPLSRKRDLVTAMACLGTTLIALHLQRSFEDVQSPVSYEGKAHPSVDRVVYSGGTVSISRTDANVFTGIDEPVWNFHIGGYQVCEKWLKDRKGRILSAEDIIHYGKVVGAISETIRVMAEIDMAIEGHGGWPGAFA